MSAFTIYKREVTSYFAQPTAYAIIVIFLLIGMGLTFTFGAFIPAGDASLASQFFAWHPWIFMFLAPAVGMKLWTDEQRNGTIELLGTFPLSIRSAIVGKFMAAATVWLAAFLLTFPIVITVNHLGDPDNRPILPRYLGRFLVCSTFLAITMLVSACTRDQVVCLIVAVAVCFLMVVGGFDAVTTVLSRSVSETLAEAATAAFVWDHFSTLTRGLFRLQDLVWFGSIIVVCLLGTSAILSAKRS